MSNITETTMANAFNEKIRISAIKGLPAFDLIYREIVCQQGIADFVGLTSASFIRNNAFGELSSLDCSSQVLSLLKYKSGRSIKYLRERTGISEVTMARTLKDMISKNYISFKNDLYYLTNTNIINRTDIWAFELKLSNWKRAIFQALQYKAFANYAVVVFPIKKEKLIKENLESFQKLNIGVLLFDAETSESKWLSRAKKESPMSRWHTLFLLTKMSNQFSQENYFDNCQ